MTMLKNRALLLAKIEQTYGTDPTPTNLLNAILCEDPEIEINGVKLERNFVKSSFGAKSFVNLAQGSKITFTTELKGSGAAGTAPEIGCLLQACGFTETVTPATSSVYAPNSLIDTAKSVTIYFSRHNIMHEINGAVGTFSIESKVNEYPKIKWEFQGLYVGPIDSAIVAGTFNATLPPIFRAAQFQIDAYAAVIESLKIDVKNEIAMRRDANAATGIVSYFIKERSVSGEIDPEIVALATKNFFSLWEAGTAAAFTARFGATAGNICTITASHVQLEQPKYGDRDNILTAQIPLVFTPSSAGNDEISISFT